MGVEPICRALQFAPSTYYATLARPVCQRRQRDEILKLEILRVHQSNCDGVYGAKKIWKQLSREGESYDEVGIRVDEGINKLVSQYPGQKIIVVMDNGVVKEAARLALGASGESIFHIDVAPCSISTIAVWPSDGLCAIRGLNELGHLREMEKNE